MIINSLRFVTIVYIVLFLDISKEIYIRLSSVIDCKFTDVSYFENMSHHKRSEKS